MLHYLTGTDLWMNPQLASSMFRDRKRQFADRLGWRVDVDRNGYERDQYDPLNPVYVVISDPDGNHTGSMRLLPTTGRTMINDFFSEILEGGPICDPRIWECTRFCVSERASRNTAAQLFAAAGFLLQELDVESLVAVFDQQMLRKYRISRVLPRVLGEGEVAGSNILAGKWAFDRDWLRELIDLSKLDQLEFEVSFVNSSLYNPNIRWIA